MIGQGSRRIVLVWIAACAVACAPAEGGSGEMMSTGSGAGESAGLETWQGDAGTPLPSLRCPTPAGHSGRPRTIAQAVEHIAALPAPVDVPCVLESLARPLPVLATSSVFSAQPGFGERSPRLFVFFEGLVLSFATEGEGALLVEFAEFLDVDTSIKGELELPVDPDVVRVEDAFEQVAHETGTNCRFCHRDEQPAALDRYVGAFASDALAPRADTLVDLDVVREHADSCDPTEDAYRCAIFDALFSGPVVDGAFDPVVPTIFDYEE